MAAVKVMRRLLYPAGVLVAVPVFIPKIQAEEKKPCLQCCTNRLPKAHELPLYKQPDDPSHYELIEEPPSSLEQGISVVRKSVSKYFAVLEVAGKRASEIYETGVAHTKNTYDYLTDDDNMIPRGLAITTGGLVGLLLAARGGIIRKVLYASVGSSTVAAACYPTQAKELIKTGFYTTKDQTNALIMEYTGYDLSKMSTDAKEKLESVVDLKKIQDVPSSMMDWFKKASPIDQMGEKVSDVMYYGFKLLDMKSDSQVTTKVPTADSPKVTGDPGQSNSKDSDLYTTRSRS